MTGMTHFKKRKKSVERSHKGLGGRIPRLDELSKKLLVQREYRGDVREDDADIS